MAVKERQDTCEDIQNTARKPKTTKRGAGGKKRVYWNHESFQGNLLCYYIRNKGSFQNCHPFIVSSIHAFIQQTFTGCPLYTRHCARQAGRMRILVAEHQSTTNHYVPATLAFLWVFVKVPFMLQHKSQLRCFFFQEVLPDLYPQPVLDQIRLACYIFPQYFLLRLSTVIIPLSSPIDSKLVWAGTTSSVTCTEQMNELGFMGKLQVLKCMQGKCGIWSSIDSNLNPSFTTPYLQHLKQVP